MKKFLNIFLALVLAGASAFSQNPINRIRLEHPQRVVSNPLPNPPYAIFYGYTNSGLSYFYSMGPSSGSATFSLLAVALAPAASTVNIGIPTNFELYNPNTSLWTNTSFTLAYTGGTITQSGYKIRLKAGVLPNTYNETFTVTSSATSFTLGVSGYVSTTTDFIIVVKTDNAGSSTSTQFEIPLNPAYSYGVVVDWGDNSISQHSTNVNPVHTYSAAGTYTVKINGIFPAIRFAAAGDGLKLISINQWGSNQWLSMNYAFGGCSNMVANYSDYPNLSLVADMYYCFYACSLFNGNLNSCNVSGVISFEAVFYGCSIYNQPLNNWNVSSGNTMSYMFGYCYAFNQNINNWNVSNVYSFTSMFQFAFIFNQPLNNWVTTSAQTMAFMFDRAFAFNQNISNFDMNGVVNVRDMFFSNSVFNQPIGVWDMSTVQVINEMFYGAVGFNQDISSWNVISLTNASDFMYAKTASDYNAAYLDAIYNTWSTLTLQPNVQISFGGIKHTATSNTGKSVLTSAPNNWTVVDGGL